MLATYSVIELVDLENFLAMKNLTLLDRLQEAQYNFEACFKKVRVVLSVFGLYTTERVLAVGIGLCLCGFMIDCSIHEAT